MFPRTHGLTAQMPLSKATSRPRWASQFIPSLLSCLVVAIIPTYHQNFVRAIMPAWNDCPLHFLPPQIFFLKFTYLAVSGLSCGTWGFHHSTWALCRGAWALALRSLLACMACGIFASLPGIEPKSPALQGRFSTTGQPGKSPTPDF